MDALLKDHLRKVNSMRLARAISILLIHVSRAIVFAFVFMGMWASLDPKAQDSQLLVGLVTLVIFLALGFRFKSSPINDSAVLKALEIKYPKIPRSAFQLRESNPDNMVWCEILKDEQKAFLKENLRMVSYKGSTLLLAGLMCLLVTQIAPGAMTTAIFSMKKVVAQINQGEVLYVVEGREKDKDPDSYKLSSSKIHEFNLLEQNRIEIRVVSGRPIKPYVIVQPKGAGLKQTFRLSPAKSDDARDAQWVHAITFNVEDDADLFLSSVSTDTPVASINVKRLPVPRVAIKPTMPLEDPWPDERPFPLEIDVEAENPLQLVRLRIRSEGQTHEELVRDILAKDKYELKTQYSLLLSSYVQQDVATIEIVAEAIDRALPNPLIGRSQPLVIRTASAYGRYRETLSTLREIKSVLDEAREQQKETLDPALKEMMNKASQQAQRSPFFDSLDRHNLRRIQQDVAMLLEKMDSYRLLDVSEKLNNFLAEHETLDDRERDRDFFVAARSLSRLLEKKVLERPIESRTVLDRLKKFLDERQRRWQIRTSRLNPLDVPEEWDSVSKGQFQKEMDKIADLSTNDEGTEKALQNLSEVVADYKQWTQNLEAAEDKARRAAEQQRQQGLADSRKTLRELQKRQSKVSSGLDRSAQQQESALKSKWSSLRMEQNANIKQTGSLEAQLRSLSPEAAERIKAAREAMNMAVSAGNEDSFIQAESASDMAGRLLRQADSAANRSQRKSQRSGRRRRVASDQYHGSSVVGGDVEIKREYQVNRRYREDVLDEVSRARATEGRDKELLENYLRKVIR